ncbi:hypothetical protein ACFCYI_24735 [Streptomyces sp. NPDC056257]|uniref:hypothetical protein n=1 Tax=Streptomyces sp. NPDC056257 TaxID=3345765 RepID=UPI0035E05D35
MTTATMKPKTAEAASTRTECALCGFRRQCRWVNGLGVDLCSRRCAVRALLLDLRWFGLHVSERPSWPHTSKQAPPSAQRMGAVEAADGGLSVRPAGEDTLGSEMRREWWGWTKEDRKVLDTPEAALWLLEHPNWHQAGPVPEIADLRASGAVPPVKPSGRWVFKDSGISAPWADGMTCSLMTGEQVTKPSTRASRDRWRSTDGTGQDRAVTEYQAIRDGKNPRYNARQAEYRDTRRPSNASTQNQYNG